MVCLNRIEQPPPKVKPVTKAKPLRPHPSISGEENVHRVWEPITREEILSYAPIGLK